MSEPLLTSPVFRNLEHRTSFLGLTPFDVPLIMGPGTIVFLVTVVVGASSLWSVLVSCAVAAALVAIKWRKPPHYLQTTVQAWLLPRRLSHKERDVALVPFPFAARLESRPSGGSAR